MRAFFAGLMLLQFVHVAVAHNDPFMGGRELYLTCMAEGIAFESGESAFEETFCHGFIQGAFEVFSREYPDWVCVPSDVSRHHIRDAWMQAIRNSDELLAEPAYASVLAVIQHLYPCQ